MKISSRLIALFVSLYLLGGIGCEPEPKPQEPPSEERSPESPPVIDRGEDGLGTIDDEDEKVNDLNDLGDAGESGEIEGECPAPEASEDMCAQVIVWARSEEGICCEYPTPCHAPEGWETFGSEQACAAGEE